MRNLWNMRVINVGELALCEAKDGSFKLIWEYLSLFLFKHSLFQFYQNLNWGVF